MALFVCALPIQTLLQYMFLPLGTEVSPLFFKSISALQYEQGAHDAVLGDSISYTKGIAHVKVLEECITLAYLLCPQVLTLGGRFLWLRTLLVVQISIYHLYLRQYGFHK